MGGRSVPGRVVEAIWRLARLPARLGIGAGGPKGGRGREAGPVARGESGPVGHRETGRGLGIMSLWYKPIREIAFEDVDAFCSQQIPEDIRLDYKVDISEKQAKGGTHPAGIEKLVAAFANTQGGLILLGVDADKKTNRPIWPPLTGMPEGTDVGDRIISICQANLFPPLQPEVSDILPNRHRPGNVITVVRVPESRDAPHTINNGRRIYERVGSQNDGCDYAHIDRIEQLLRRRQVFEGQRERYTQEAIDRSLRQMADPLPLAARWAVAVPYYPWRDLCEPRRCREVEDLLHRVLSDCPIWVRLFSMTTARQ